MALLSLVGWQTQRLDMDQAFNPLSGSARFQGTGECFDSDNSYTLTTPGPAVGQVGNEGRTISVPSSALCCSRGVPRALPTTCLLRYVWPLSPRVLVEAQWADQSHPILLSLALACLPPQDVSVFTQGILGSMF